MSKYKVSELTGALLDAAVAIAEGLVPVWQGMRFCMVEPTERSHGLREFRPSSDWAVGGPIIERERITFEEVEEGDEVVAYSRPIEHGGIVTSYCGTHPTSYLIAAMRAFVAAKLGEEVELPT